MSDAQTIDHDEHEQQLQAGADQAEQQTEPPSKPVPAVIEPEAAPIIARRELVPVRSTGAAPMNLQQQIDFAQSMAKAVISLPSHLRGNVGDCLAILDISSRAGLSPYMVANKTYVQNERLCFESQLFHAFLVQSGLIIGDLEVSYDGEGPKRTCTVVGILKSDRKPRSYTSPPLEKLHPGFTEKNGRKWVKGSPLWEKKPDVQLFYDTSRDWTRIYAPTATLGMYTPDEMIETPLGPEGAIEVREVSPDLHERLKGTDRTEGHKPGHAENELSNVAAGGAAEIKPAAAKQRAKGTAPAAKAGSRRARRAERATGQPKAEATAAPAEDEKEQKEAKTPKVEEKSPIQKQAEANQDFVPNGQPKTGAEYFGYARSWIMGSTNADDAEARWDGERDMRDELGVALKRRHELEKLLFDAIKELRGKE